MQHASTSGRAAALDGGRTGRPRAPSRPAPLRRAAAAAVGAAAVGAATTAAAPASQLAVGPDALERLSRLELFAPPMAEDPAAMLREGVPFLTRQGGALPAQPRDLDHALYLYGE
jgi:hypothetical protein